MIKLAVVLFSAFGSACAPEPTSPSPQTVDRPERFYPEVLGQNGRVTLTPGFSPDGRTLYFSQSECSRIGECPQRLKRSRLTPDGWSIPELVPLPAEGRSEAPSVTPDGQRLLFSWATTRSRHKGRNVGSDFDLYSLDLSNSTAVPQPLDMADINRIRGGEVRTLRYVHNETAPNLTRDGDLYFWTERLDGIGERDVYVAQSDGQGGFLTARPLPAPINSAGRDDGAWISPDGRLMLITYPDRGGSGASDLFVSHQIDGLWSEPRNLGPLVNSPYNDGSGRLTPDGALLVFSSDRPVGDGSSGLLQVWSIDASAVSALSLGLRSSNEN